MSDRSVFVRIKADLDGFNRGLLSGAANAKKFASSLDATDSRMSNLVQTSLALGPALVPIAASATPAIAGLASQLGFAAAGAGVAALAFSGVGDALEAVNNYQLEPTTENFAKMQEEMAKLGPAGRDFTRFLQDLRPELQGLQDIAQEGMLPGVQEGIEDLMTLMPEVEGIVSTIASTMGDLASEAGANLASPEWRSFFTFLETSARPTLLAFGRTIGNFTEGLANLWMAFDPLSQDFSSSLLNMSRDFAQWSDQLGSSEGFASFVEYVRSVGPQAWETLGALANALMEIVIAAAPVGQAVLPVIEVLADGLAIIASSPAGPVLIGIAAGFSAVSRAVALFNAANGLALVNTLRGVGKDGKAATGALAGLSRAGAGLAGVAIGIAAISAAAAKFDEDLPGLNTLSNRLLDLSNGGIGDLGPQFDSLGESIDQMANRDWNDTFLGMDSKSTRVARAEIEAIDAALTNLVGSGGPDQARAAFEGLVESQNLTAREARQMMSILPGYKEALAGAETGARGAAAGNRALTAAQKAAGRAAADLRADLVELNNTLEGRASMRSYEEALDQVGKSVKENGRSLDITTGKGRRNAQTLDDIAGAALGVAENMGKTNKIQFLNRARADFIDAATKMTGSAKAAERLADRLGLVERADPTVKFAERGAADLRKTAGVVLKDLFNVDRQRPTPTLSAKDNATGKIDPVLAGLLLVDRTNPSSTITADGGGALSTINSVAGNLRSINGMTAQTYIITNRIEKVTRQLARADGGAVYGPGTATSDSIPALLSDGEYVIKAAAVDKYGTHMFDRLNAMAYANGGPVQRFATGGKPDILTDRELNRSLREFNVRPDDGFRDARSELRDFARAIRQAGGEVTNRFGRLSDRLVNLSGNYDQISRALEREKDQRRNLLQARSSLNSTVRGTFNNDIFGNGVAGGFLQLEADRNDARKMLSASRRASRLGLSGGAERALLESGDLNFAQQLNTRSEVRRFEALFAQRASAQRALGGFAGNEMYGRQINQQNRLINRQTRLMGRLENKIERLESSVERGTYRGSFDANRGRNKDTRARSRRR